MARTKSTETQVVPPELGNCSVNASVSTAVFNAINEAAVGGWRTRAAQVAKILTEWWENESRENAALEAQADADAEG